MSPLVNRIKQLSQPLAPEPTGESPVLPKLAGIRAVVFDVYGTLLVSGSGDISLTSGAARGEAASEALTAVGIEKPVDGQRVVETLLQAIQRDHRESPHEFPEVEIRDIWRTTLDDFGVQLGEEAVELLAVEYECRVNPIWPMPGLEDCLTTIANGGLLLGIVSNAQFFTPLAFPALTGQSLDQWGFAPDWCVWSYAHRRAKPGVFLYEQAAAALAERGVSPGETLYVGNDLRNDVWPAQRVGMRTALFAGDQRSLRWRKDDSRVAGVRPDVVLTSLRQILSVLSLAGN